MTKEYFYCTKEQFKNLEMYLFSLEFQNKPNKIYEIIVDNLHYYYDYLYEFGKWRIITN